MPVRWKRLLLCVVLGLLLAVAAVSSLTEPRSSAAAAEPSVFSNAVVAADHPLASRAGAEILESGGNVVDAAVATSFALSVVRPASCGIGGGGFMVIWNAQKRQAIALDYRERAPAEAHRRMYVDSTDPRTSRSALSRRGHLAVAVPGTVAGLCYALEHYGTLDLKTVLQPAIRLARNGVQPDRHDRIVQGLVLRRFKEHPEYRQEFRTLFELYLNAGVPWGPNQLFKSPQLTVLEKIATEGKDGFYIGPVGEALLAEFKRGRGLITKEDLATMQPVVREPLRGRFSDFDILTMPPPSSGGVALLETFNTLTAYREQHLQSGSQKQSTSDSLHVLVEALKHAFADRAEFLGDADFANVPVDRLISVAYARQIAKTIDNQKTQAQDVYGRFQPVEDAGTSHFSVIDSQGNAVACTETINTTFGSFVVEPTYGIVLNNEMDDFAAVPGQPNAYGLIQSEANAVEGRKKPLSSMTPTIVVQDGKAVYAVGGSGGPMIISSTLQVLLNLFARMSPAEAVAQPRIHHQWIPNTLFAEPDILKRARALESRGHAVQQRSGIAATQAVSRQADGLRGGSDPRKGGRPAGY